MKWKQEHCFFSDGLADIFNRPSKITFAETPHAGIILFGCKGYFSAARFESSTPVSLLTKIKPRGRFFVKQRLDIFCQKRLTANPPFCIVTTSDAGWSSMVARRAHNPKVVGSNPAPATKYKNPLQSQGILLYAAFIADELMERPSEPLGFRRPFTVLRRGLGKNTTGLFSDGLFRFGLVVVAQVFFQALQFFFVQPFIARTLQQNDQCGDFVTHIGAEPEEALPVVMQAGGRFA